MNSYYKDKELLCDACAEEYDWAKGNIIEMRLPFNIKKKKYLCKPCDTYGCLYEPKEQREKIKLLKELR